jgi:hypothetical protein
MAVQCRNTYCKYQDKKKMFTCVLLKCVLDYEFPNKPDKDRNREHVNKGKRMFKK